MLLGAELILWKIGLKLVWGRRVAFEVCQVLQEETSARQYLIQNLVLGMRQFGNTDGSIVDSY